VAATEAALSAPAFYQGALQTTDATAMVNTSLQYGQHLQPAQTQATGQQLTAGHSDQTHTFSSHLQPQAAVSQVATSYALPQLIASQAAPQLATNSNIPQLISHTTPQLVSHTTPQLISQTTPQLINQMTPQLMNQTTPQLIASQAAPQLIQQTNPQLIAANNTVPQLIAKQADTGLAAPGQKILVTSLNGQVPVWATTSIQPQYTGQLSAANPVSSTRLAQNR